jgi:Ca2+-binding EF-hand superfamily protein
VILSFEDQSGVSGPTGTAIDGLINLFAVTADDIFTETLLAIDGDGDGFVSREEIRAMRHQAERRAMEGFRKLDTDGSGGVSFEEFSKGEFSSKLPEEKLRQVFNRMDTDGNGEINGDDRPNGSPGKPGARPERRPDRQPLPR